MSTYNLEQEEKQNRQFAFIVTSAVNILLFIMLWYVTVWNSEENKKVEKIGGGGFVVNFGTDKDGSGSIYTKNHGNKAKNEYDSKPAEVKPLPKKEPTPIVEKVKPVKAKPSPEPEVIKSTRPSPVKVPEVTKKVEKAKENPKANVPVTKPTPAKPVEQQVIKGATIPVRTGGNGTSGTDSRTGGGSDGNGKGIGNQGQPNGNVVKGGTYNPVPPGSGNGGNGGNGSGTAISLAGWTWNSRPEVNDDSDETGIVKFRLKVDSDGVVQVVETIESSLSPSVTQKYKRAVQKLTFRPTSAGERPDISVGTITFRISSK